MNLETPSKIRTLQRKLYRKAKDEPDYRFYLLYDKVYREDILLYAYELAKSNQGAPGVDGETFAAIEWKGLGEWLAGIRNELRTRTYQPQPVRRVMIPKPGGGERPLGIPTIRDRVVQTAAKLVLEPIFEADLEPCAYGYRPKRSAQDAIQKVHELLGAGYTDVVDADLSKYFDTIPHSELMRCVARRIVDRDMLRLIKAWLKVPVEERDGKGNRTMTGGRSSRGGTPQGGVVSPLLANLYMNRFLKGWRITQRGKQFRAQITLREARQESFDFLGYTFGPQRYWKDGHEYLGAAPSKKSVARLKLKVNQLLGPGNGATWPEVRYRLNCMLRGWSNYFSHGTRRRAYRAVDNHVAERVRHFLRRRQHRHMRGTRTLTDAMIFRSLGVLQLHRVPPGARP